MKMYFLIFFGVQVWFGWWCMSMGQQHWGHHCTVLHFVHFLSCHFNLHNMYVYQLSKAQSFQSVEPRTKLCTRLRLHQFCLTHLTQRVESNKTDAKEVSYEASYETPLARKTRLNIKNGKTFVSAGLNLFCKM